MIILQERYRPEDTSWARKLILELGPELSTAESATEIQELLNRAFQSEDISFSLDEVYGHDWLYGEVGIQLSGIYEDGSIYIVLDSENIVDKLSDPPVLQEFARALQTILAHELLHRQQLKVIPYEFQVERRYSGESNELYLSNPREVDAHAREAIEELLSIGHLPEDLRAKLSSYSELKDLAHDSKALWKYWDYFGVYDEHGSDPVWKRLLSKMASFLNAR